MSSQVIVLQGVSGSGKSSYVNAFNGPKASCSADDYFVQDSGYRFNPAQLGEAHAWCLRRFIYQLSTYTGGDSSLTVLVDNTNTAAIEIAPYMAIAAAYNVPAKIVTIECDLDLAFRRNQHNVPMSTIQKQAARIKQSHSQFPKHWEREIIRKTYLGAAPHQPSDTKFDPGY